MERQKCYKRNLKKKSMEYKLKYLLDTCILIDFLRGDPSVYDLLVPNKEIELSMSTVTMMELILGAFNKREVSYIQQAFKNINIVYINQEISKMAEDLIFSYSKSHNLQIDDAFIAATAIKTNRILITHNISDFTFIPDIQLYHFNEN